MSVTLKNRGENVFGDVTVLDDLTVNDDANITGDIVILGGFTLGEDGDGSDFTVYGDVANYKIWFDANGDTNGAFYFGANLYGIFTQWFGDTTGYYVKWDPTGDTNGAWYFGADTKGVQVNLYGDVTGCGVFWDPTTDTNGTLTIGGTGGSKGNDVIIYGVTSGSYAKWDQSADDLILNAACLVFTGTSVSTIDLSGATSTTDIILSNSATLINAADTLTIEEATTKMTAATLFGVESADIRLGISSGVYVKYAVTATTGVTAITQTGTGPTLSWTVPAATWTNSTSNFVYTPDFRVGYAADAYIKAAVTATTGVAAITQAGSGPTLAWTVPTATWTHSTSSSIFTPSLVVGFDAGAATTIATTDATGVVAITHAGSGPTMSWTIPTWTNTNSTSYSTFTPSWVMGFDVGAAMTVAVTNTTGVTAITHAGSGPTVTWTADSLSFVGDFDSNGATAALDGSTSVRLISAGFTSLESPANRFGLNATEYIQIATTVTTGATAITHTGSGPDVTWAADSLAFTGDLSSDGATALFDGSTSFRGVSAGFTSLESPANRLGLNATEYIQFATTVTTGATAITHTGSGPDVTWTADSLAFTGDFSSDGATVVLDGSTSARLLSAGFDSLEAPDIRLGLNATEYMKFAVTVTTGAVAITHTGSGAAVTWTAPSLAFTGNFSSDGATAALDGSTSVRGISAGFVSLESPANRLGLNATEYIQFATTVTTGATAITHTGSGPAVTWTADSLAFTGDFSSDGATAALDGSTSVRGLSAGFVSLEAPDIRFGYSAGIYTKFAVANTTGNLTITHVGGSTDLVTWTAAGGFSLVGNVAVTGTFGASGTLSVGLDATAGMLELYPTTTNLGTTTLTMADNSGDTITNINIAAQAGARTLTVPDAGASANFVMMTASQAVAGTLTRADLTEEALACYGLPLAAMKQVTGIPLVAAETAGTFNLDLAADVWLVQGEISISETETSEGALQFILPPEYVSGGDVSVRIKNRCVLGAGTDNGSTLDVEVFEQDGNGAIGADICSTAAVTYAASSAWQTTDFTVTGAALVPGDILNIVVTTNVVESGASAIHVDLDGIALLLDIKG